MEENQETITNIIAEKRRRADEIERDCAEKMKRGEMISDCFARELVADIRREADRLEAAHKREVDKLNSAIQATVSRSDAEIDRLRREIAEMRKAGNAAKLREALEFIKQYFDKIDPFNISTYTFSQIEVDHINEAINAALAAPPRTCDKYSADELKDIFNSELSLKLQMANKKEKKLVAITAMGMIDILLAPSTEKEGGAK